MPKVIDFTGKEVIPTEQMQESDIKELLTQLASNELNFKDVIIFLKDEEDNTILFYSNNTSEQDKAYCSLLLQHDVMSKFDETEQLDLDI